MSISATERSAASARHTTFYFEAGPEDGVPIILVHGWPELAISWRKQIPVLAGLGFRVVAPDMRGYGRSSRHARTEDYAMEECVEDLLELLAALGCEKAIWVGHDFGAAVVWALASHHPDVCLGVANLCVPYLPNGFTLENVVALVDRQIYPHDRYPHGQWAYWNFHIEHPDQATQALSQNIEHSVRMIFRRGAPELRGKATGGSMVVAPGGWRPLLELSRQAPRDEHIMGEEDFHAYVSALTRNGFEAADAYYRNNDRNAAYAARTTNDGRIDLPTLFIHALYDPTCNTVGASLAEPMRAHCGDLTEYVVKAGHWVQQEKGAEVSAALVHWLATRLPATWGLQNP
jgi:pimeloyl-ACP methyl ester carboxylesterase